MMAITPPCLIRGNGKHDLLSLTCYSQEQRDPQPQEATTVREALYRAHPHLSLWLEFAELPHDPPTS